MRLLKTTLCSLLCYTTFIVGMAVPPVKAESAKQIYETPEQVKVKTFEIDSDGEFVVTGYKEITSNTKVIKEGSVIEAIVHSKEDIFDIDGNYLATKYIYEDSINDLETGEAKVKRIVEEETEGKNSNSTIRSKRDASSIVDIVESKVDILSEDFKESKGITYEQVEEIRDTAEKLKEKIDRKGFKSAFANSVLAAGAFDNYYNEDLSDGTFTVQVLSEQAHKYVKGKGNVKDGNNARSLSKFQGYIDDYEEGIMNDMKASKYIPEVTAWVVAIASAIALVAGFPVGAAGWAQAVYAGAATTSTLAAITGAAYATNARLQASAEVAANLASAQKVMNYKNWTNTKFTLVSGY
jgi:hypothetical protein